MSNLLQMKNETGVSTIPRVAEGTSLFSCNKHVDPVISCVVFFTVFESDF